MHLKVILSCIKKNLFIAYVADSVIKMEHVMRQDKHKQSFKPTNLRFCKRVAHYTQTNTELWNFYETSMNTMSQEKMCLRDGLENHMGFQCMCMREPLQEREECVGRT